MYSSIISPLSYSAVSHMLFLHRTIRYILYYFPSSFAAVELEFDGSIVKSTCWMPKEEMMMLMTEMTKMKTTTKSLSITADRWLSSLLMSTAPITRNRIPTITCGKGHF